MDKHIVTKEEIEEYQGIKKTHFLNMDAQRINKSLGDLTGLENIGFHIIEIEPGKVSTEFHKHNTRKSVFTFWMVKLNPPLAISLYR